MRNFSVSRQEISKNEYYKLHQRVRKILGKASYCSNVSCTNKDAKRFEWALKKGKAYSDDPYDYFSLCQSCHRHYDITPETKAKMSHAAKGNKARMSVFVSVDQFDLSGFYLNTYPTIEEASRRTNTARSSIWSNIKGRYKQANNFLWAKSKNKDLESLKSQ